MKPSLQLVLPDLLSTLARADAAVVKPLAQILARGDRLSSGLSRFGENPQASYFAATLALLGLTVDARGSLPPAVVSASFDLAAPVTSPILRADPVYLRADASRLSLYPANLVELNAEDADELLVELNQSFDDTPFDFCRGEATDRWYLIGAPAFEGDSYSPRDLAGQVLEPSLAASQHLGQLKRVMTEAQMILYECATNQRREASGLPPINSIWIWGGGQISAMDKRPSPYLLTEDAELLAAARYCGVTAESDMTGLARLLKQTEQNIVVASPPAALGQDLERLTAEIFTPALAALRRGQLADISLSTIGGGVQIRRSHGLRYWRSWRRWRDRLAADGDESSQA